MPAPNQKKDRTPPWEDQSGQEQISFGSWLRRQREIREIPLREIADVTKISLRYLEALEQDRFDVLPAPVFARGFLREYSKYVGLDPDEVVNSYLTADRDTAEAEAAAAVEGATDTAGSSRQAVIAAVVALVALLGLIYAAARFWPWSGEQRQPPPMAAPVAVAEPVSESVEAATLAQASELEPEPEAEPAAPIVMTMDFREDCWVEVEVDGERRLSELHVQGESMKLEAEEAIRLTLGNPAGVHLEVNGRVYGLDFARGRVARDLLIDMDLVRELESGSQ